jgi:hypothetical protein
MPVIVFYFNSLPDFISNINHKEVVPLNLVSLLFVLIESVLIKNGFFKDHSNHYIKKYKHKSSIYIFLVSLVGQVGMISTAYLMSPVNNWLFYSFYTLFLLSFTTIWHLEEKIEERENPPKYDLPSLQSE